MSNMEKEKVSKVRSDQKSSLVELSAGSLGLLYSVLNVLEPEQEKVVLPKFALELVVFSLSILTIYFGLADLTAESDLLGRDLKENSRKE